MRKKELFLKNVLHVGKSFHGKKMFTTKMTRNKNKY